MNYIHYGLNLQSNDVVEVTLDKQANVRLLDSTNYSNYKLGKQYKYYGGLATKSPSHISPPSAGYWHLVIDLGGYPGTVTASVKIIKR
jgi:hypothetical protein